MLSSKGFCLEERGRSPLGLKADDSGQMSKQIKLMSICEQSAAQYAAIKR